MDHDVDLSLSLELSVHVLGPRRIVNVTYEFFKCGNKRLCRQQAMVRQVWIAMLECIGSDAANDIFFAIGANEPDAVSVKKW